MRTMQSVSARCFLSARSGAAAVEFAFVGPVLMTLIVGILMLGMAHYEGATVQWSLERALRVAMIDSEVSKEEIEALMAEDLARIGSPDVNLSYEIDESGSVPVAVASASYEVPLNIPFLPDLALRYAAENVTPVPAD